MRTLGVLFLILAALRPCAVAAQAAEQTAANCSGWKASRNVKSFTYYISATCEMPTPGHTVELVPADPQGTDLTVYTLNEVVHAPEGMVAQVITPFKLHYRKRTRIDYKQFVINPGSIHIPVEQAQSKTSPGESTPGEATPEKK